ncbi:hypothetical protein [Pseudonocardia acaciae]|uniref:hypothetical protein n=1 Tax=Pseudonocardia acaciae TaxID=551276 RepID=UPI00048BA705|nr:hypothetical protein [Pseudonocardia acaciae]
MYLELGPKKVFACSVDWPGLCRVRSGEEPALDALREYEPRYRPIAERAGLGGFRLGELTVVERARGGSSTDFGAPGAIPELDAAPVGAEEAGRAVALMRAAWAAFAEAAAESPAELRKGPRGGGRDRDKMVAHVVEAERSYARKVGVRHRPFDVADPGPLAALRDELVEVLGRPSDGAPPVERGWPARYAVRRIVWHVLDHLWEMQDRAS